MFSISVKTPSIKMPTLLTRQIMLGAGVFVVNNYKERLNRGMGIDESGNLVKLKPLSPATIKAKGSNIPLIDTKNMVGAFRVDTGLATEKKVIFNFPPSESWKAGIHQKGVKTGKVNIPARPHVGISGKDLKDATKWIELKTGKKLKEGIKIGKAE